MDGYVEDQKPCLVAVKQCGCVVAVSHMDPDDKGDWEAGKDFVREVKAQGARVEFRPVSFIRNGGLEFDCPHFSIGTAEHRG
jgi:hypothetical protein